MSERPLIEINHITKSYKTSDMQIPVLKGCTLSVNQGEVVAIVGPSGSGKTTLLSILGGLDYPDEGEVIFNGRVLLKDNKSLTEYRKNNIGFVLQQYGLVSDLSVYQNVEIVRRLVNSSMTTESMLESVAMHHKKKCMPHQLSGGEQQRVAIARALVKKPTLLLCDEPTGALDVSTGAQIINTISRLAKATKQTVIIVTHDMDICRFANRIVKLDDGILHE